MYLTRNKLSIVFSFGAFAALGQCAITEQITVGSGIESGGMMQGSINTSNVPVRYQSSANLSRGCNVLDTDTCYTMALPDEGSSIAANAGANLDENRQRIEFYTEQGVALEGEQWEYSWQSYVYPETTTTENFCHFWQILQRGSEYSGPVFSQTSSNGEVGIKYTRENSNPPECGVLKFSNFRGNILDHRLLLTFGSGNDTGELIYRMQVNGSTQVYCYSAEKDTGNNESSLKVGFYRAVADDLDAGTVELSGFYAWPSNESTFSAARLEANQFNDADNSSTESGFRSGRSGWTWTFGGATSIEPPFRGFTNLFLFATLFFSLGLFAFL